ncbi:MAG TPA: hypothetical protein VH374_22805 [Polyangia bacterium]|jgi:uncharacterized coiled-coil DUF342 family protein|nr:hypothetical protein [Polyangia bacterium]
MKQPTGLRIAAFLLIAATVSCDKSKPALDKAQQEVKEVSSQRDNLKMQLDLSEGKLAEAQKRIGELEAAAQASAAASATAAASTKGAKGKGGKTAAKSKRSHKKHH